MVGFSIELNGKTNHKLPVNGIRKFERPRNSLYSREVSSSSTRSVAPSFLDATTAPSVDRARDAEAYPGRQVGGDPGKKNLVTMTDSEGISLRYTCRQRRFEGKLSRYLDVLRLEKSRACGVMRAERDLSEHSRKTNDHSDFLSYLREKKNHDDWTGSFYSGGPGSLGSTATERAARTCS